MTPLIKIKKRWELPEAAVTDERLFMSRRKLMQLGAGALGAALLGCKADQPPAATRPTAPTPPLAPPALKPGFSMQNPGPINPKDPILFGLEDVPSAFRPAARAAAYDKVERDITAEFLPASFNNFYEFSEDKELVWRNVGDFKTRPWAIEVGGLCRKPAVFDIDDLLQKMPHEERVYRFRCVEAWSMVVPWTGFPLAALLAAVDPTPEARFVRLITAKQAGMPGIKAAPWFPWPYYEGLRMDEAMHPLTLIATGIYGHALPRQHGAPARLVVPWKYGFKSIKSVVKIELVAQAPPTFWHDLAPDEYSFLGNVEPEVPHPRWSQATEQPIDGGPRIATLPYNGYAAEVAALYKEG